MHEHGYSATISDVQSPRIREVFLKYIDFINMTSVMTNCISDLRNDLTKRRNSTFFVSTQSEHLNKEHFLSSIPTFLFSSSFPLQDYFARSPEK